MLQCQINDDQWHNLHVRRRANFLQAWVDDCPRVPGLYNVTSTASCDFFSLRRMTCVLLMLLSMFLSF